MRAAVREPAVIFCMASSSLSGIVREILQMLHAVIECQDRNIASLAGDQALQQHARLPDLRKHRLDFRIRLHRQHDGNRLLGEFGADLLRLVVVIELQNRLCLSPLT